MDNNMVNISEGERSKRKCLQENRRQNSLVSLTSSLTTYPAATSHPYLLARRLLIIWYPNVETYRRTMAIVEESTVKYTSILSTSCASTTPQSIKSTQMSLLLRASSGLPAYPFLKKLHTSSSLGKHIDRGGQGRH
ncbi:MAG: hypothetical protein Q9163_003437 [Psora crenata]